MRKSTTLGFALCGTLLVILLFIAGRMLYIKFYHQSFTDIAGKGVQASLMLSENDTSLPAVTDEKQIASYTDLLGGYTYTPYPHFFQPGDDKLTANRLTVTFENGSSISVNADGFVFVDGKLRGIEGGRGQEFYHKLYILFYPNAT